MTRYQSDAEHVGAFDTPRWFGALLAGFAQPLGSVLDVGCAEGVMCRLAADAGASPVVGVEPYRTPEPDPRVEFRRELPSDEPFRTVLLSMVAHWIGRYETVRLARLATRNLGVIFRTPHPDYQIPVNGSWFPTFAELDAAMGRARTGETLLEDHDGHEVWAAIYRTDLRVRDGWVERALPDHPEGVRALIEAGAPLDAVLGDTLRLPLYRGTDGHGDRPFRHGERKRLVADLAAQIARAALACGWVPLDFSPRNVIVDEEGAHLIDLGEIARHDGTLPDTAVSVWSETLGRSFSGRLADLL